MLSNPFVSSCTLRVTVVSGGPASVRLMDMSGKVLWASSMIAGAGDGEGGEGVIAHFTTGVGRGRTADVSKADKGGREWEGKWLRGM